MLDTAQQIIIGLAGVVCVYGAFVYFNRNLFVSFSYSFAALACVMTLVIGNMQ